MHLIGQAGSGEDAVALSYLQDYGIGVKRKKTLVMRMLS